MTDAIWIICTLVVLIAQYQIGAYFMQRRLDEDIDEAIRRYIKKAIVRGPDSVIPMSDSNMRNPDDHVSPIMDHFPFSSPEQKAAADRLRASHLRSVPMTKPETDHEPQIIKLRDTDAD